MSDENNTNNVGGINTHHVLLSSSVSDGLLGAIGNTPLIEIKSLSKLSGLLFFFNSSSRVHVNMD